MFHDDMTADEILASILYEIFLDRNEDTLANRIKYMQQTKDNWFIELEKRHDPELANDLLVLAAEINRLERICLRIKFKGESHRIYESTDDWSCE